jgi:Abnormal spindle-like microcephaly-assoc'd, ASPM-SPD-2-Hydin
VQREWSNGSPHGCVKRYGARPTTTITGNLSFGTVARGTSTTREIALQNTGNGTLDILGAYLGSGSSSALHLSPTSPFHSSLQPGDTALFDVTASPLGGSTTTGPITGSLVIDTNDTVPNDTGAPTNAQLTATNTLPVTATIGLPNVTVSGSLDFGTVPRGTSATRTVVVQNIGTADLKVTNITIAGDPTYSISPTSPTTGTLPPGGSLVAEVKFAPPTSATNGGPLTAQLTVSTDDPSTPTVFVPATGIVGLPKAVVTPPALDFSTVCPGASIDRDLTVTNTGTAPLTINSITIGGGSSAGLSVLSPPVLPVILPAGAHLAFTVRFTPTGPMGGPLSGTVLVNTDDPAGPIVSVPITGQVGQSVLTLGTTALDFGGVATDNRTSPSSRTKTLTLSNTGTCAMTVTALPIGGAAAGDYTIVGGPTLPLSIAAGSSVTISVRFNPTAAGPRNGTLTIASSDPVHPTVVVALAGVGLVPAILTSPSSLTYGPTVIQSQAPGYPGVTQPVVVTNTGQSELIIDTMVTSGAPFSAPGPSTPPSRFATSDHFSEPVTFAPTTVGKFLSSLMVADNDPEGGASASVPLCGEGVRRGIRVLAIDNAGVPFTTVKALKLQSKGTAQNVNNNVSNLSLTSVPTSCVAGQQKQYENQTLPATDTLNQRASYYTLSVTAGGKSTTITFTLGVSEFKTIVVTIK